MAAARVKGRLESFSMVVVDFRQFAGPLLAADFSV